MGSDALYLLAAELLDAAADSLTDPPGRQFVSPALPAFDCCPQLTVHPGDMAKTATLSSGPLVDYEQVSTTRPNSWVLIITVIRCSAYMSEKPSPPSPAMFDAISKMTFTDLWQIWNGVQWRIRDGRLFSSLGCKATGIGPATPLPDEGGCVGWMIPVSLVPQGEPQ